MTHPALTLMRAQALDAALRDAAAQRRRTQTTGLPMTDPTPVTIRFAGARDTTALQDLAGLDSAAPLHEPILVAEVEGGLRAALSLADGAVIADPFSPTLAVIELLRMRAEQLAARRRRGTVRVGAWLLNRRAHRFAGGSSGRA